MTKKFFTIYNKISQIFYKKKKKKIEIFFFFFIVKHDCFKTLINIKTVCTKIKLK